MLLLNTRKNLFRLLSRMFTLDCLWRVRIRNVLIQLLLVLVSIQKEGAALLRKSVYRILTPTQQKQRTTRDIFC